MDTTASKQWEYVVRTFSEGSSDALLTCLLDEERQQEWELVAFDFIRNRAIFKRPVRDKDENS